jgi:hypothetical protein
MALIRRELTVGYDLGTVPEQTPMVPLAQDLAQQQRRLRLRPSAERQDLDLDLRTPGGLRRSHLLHRLALLDIDWGYPEEAGGQTGTFHELWSLQWHPELAVKLIEASMWGTTVVDAARARSVELTRSAAALSALTTLIERFLLADLPDAVSHGMTVFAERAATDVDVRSLMTALPPLARVARYGNVRDTDISSVVAVIDGLVARICIGLAPAVTSLDDDAARQIVHAINTVHSALALLDRDEWRATWAAALEAIAAAPSGLPPVHGLVAGRTGRLLLDGGFLDPDAVARRMAAALSVGSEPSQGAAWVEGFLSGSGLVLLHDPVLMGVLDGWLADVESSAFDEVLPLLRRTFATFDEAERRQLGTLIRQEGRRAATPDIDEDLDSTRAALALPTVIRLLGLGGQS